MSICNPILTQWRDLLPLFHKWGDIIIRPMIINLSTNFYKMILDSNQKYKVEVEGY